MLLNPQNQPKFVNSLPKPERIDASDGKKLTIDMRESEQWLGLVDDQGNPLSTTIWGYTESGQSSVTYPGPTIVAQEGVPLPVEWRNKLPREGHLLPVDPTYHQAHPAAKWLEKGYVPTVTHLHGGRTDADSDGNPDAWYTQNYTGVGEKYVQKTYTYDNDQEAAPLWYHDHALGYTRLNVYAGLAGFYLLRDDNETTLVNEGVLPGGEFETELAIQDRAFTADGELFLPSDSASQQLLYGEEAFPNTDIFQDPNGNYVYRDSETNSFEYVDETITDAIDPNTLTQVPSGMAEFFGDHILVNGMTWPQLDVSEGMHRFRVLNGSDSRFYIFELHDEQFDGSGVDNFPFYKIGTDSGLFDTPMELDQLVLAPGERADIVVDFDALQALDTSRDGSADGQFYLRNFGPDSPFGSLPPSQVADENTTGQIVRFDVDPTLPASDASLDETTNLRPGNPLPDPESRLGEENFDDNGELITRKLALFEGTDEFNRLQPMLGVVGEQTAFDPVTGEQIEGTVEGSLTWHEPTTEQIALGDTEVWEIYNATGDAHPVHIHLVNFQALEVGTFDVDNSPLTEKEQPLHNGATGSGFTIAPVGVDFGDPDDLTDGYRDLAEFEMGLKDTIIVQPGEVMRLVMTFDKPGEYVWHCHILSHEDHDMMRRLNVSEDDVSNYSISLMPDIV